MNDWELTAKDAKEITEKAPLRKLEVAKKQIMQKIRSYAQDGRNYTVIQMEYYDVSCPEDWCNIYNWLLKLGYNVEDNSRSRFNPNFYLKWQNNRS